MHLPKHLPDGPEEHDCLILLQGYLAMSAITIIELQAWYSSLHEGYSM